VGARPDRVRATFRAALPYVVAVAGGNVLIGSGAPIAIEPEVWRRRLFDPSMVAYLGPSRVNGVWAEITERGTPASGGSRPRESGSLPARRVPRSGLGLHSIS
jgi:hypothetical protein